MADFKIVKVNELPLILEPNVIYLVKRDELGLFDFCVSDSSGNGVRYSSSAPVAATDVIHYSATPPNLPSDKPFWVNTQDDILYVQYTILEQTYWVEVTATSTDNIIEGSVNLYFTAQRAADAAPVQSVAGRTGTVSLTKADVQLSNVDNTADSSKAVATAAALATARTINGTSFDGSANITTANWGTARTITIGGTGKSVNGSGGVSWSLAEIGAAPSSHVGDSGGVHATATTSIAGFMSAADKTKLDGIESGANDYVLPVANSTTLGGIELGSNTVQSVAANAVTATASRTYSLQLNAAGQAVVNVPWVNTTYAVATVSVNGLMSAADKTKLDGIETGAQVNTVQSVAGRTGIIELTKADVGLANVDDTADNTKNVLSATRLTTARTINGTSFSGTANITTANWGTARNLTIGNTAKSVNGSGNVSWSLGEIGALPLAGGELTGAVRPHFVPTSITASSTFTYNASTHGQVHKLTLTNAISLVFGAPENITEGSMYKFILAAGDGAERSFAWNTAFKFPGGIPQLLSGTTALNGYDVITFIGGPGNTLIYDGHNADCR